MTEAMMNIRTVTSFGYGSENIFGKEYDRFLEKPLELSLKNSLVGGLLFGFAQSLLYFIIGLIFYLASVFLADPNNEIEVQNSFTAIFAVFFAGMTAGNNSQFLPDIRNCKVSAGKLF